jgi:hypothetical protein
LNNETDFGSITYAVTGVAPYRKFVLMFNNQPHYECNQSVISSSEIILYETLNIIDVQVTDRNVCPNWQGGVGVLGIISADGSAGLAAPGRNTGAWTAHHEGWRFARPFSADEYHYIICATGAVGTYSLDVPRNDLSPGNPSAVSFYTSEANAVSQVNPIADSFYVSGTTGTLYANVDGAIRHIVLGMVDCTNDYDGDSVATNDEDINADGNLANDDTDGDGIWNFIDNDDDGDMVLTSFEYAFAGKSAATAALTDTDGDGVPNYLDSDDDGDGVLTINEDYNGNHDPADDDTNLDGTPDYLQNTVALGVAQQQSASLSLYPNPVSGVLHVSGIENGKAEIYSVTGALVKTADASDISVSELQSGLYFIRVTSNGMTHTSKFIKQ